jgi:cobalamin-dependent methionine synthase I
VLVGGAALTRQFVKQALKPAYVMVRDLCADAFAGLHAMQDIEAGRTPPEP